MPSTAPPRIAWQPTDGPDAVHSAGPPAFVPQDGHAPMPWSCGDVLGHPDLLLTGGHRG